MTDNFVRRLLVDSLISIGRPRRAITLITISVVMFNLLHVFIPEVMGWELLAEFVPPFWDSEASKDPDIPRNQAVMNSENGRGSVLAKPQIGECAYAEVGVLEPFVYTGTTQDGMIDASLTLDMGQVYRAPEASGGSLSVWIYLYEWLPGNDWYTMYYRRIWVKWNSYVFDVDVFGRMSGFTWKTNYVYEAHVRVNAYASCGWSPQTISTASCDDIRIKSIRMWGDVPPCGNNPPPPPRFSLDRSYAWVGQEVLISGVGFEPNAQVDIYFDETLVKTTTSLVDGSFVTTFVVPEVSKDTHIIKAIDTEGDFVERPLTVVAGYEHPAYLTFDAERISPGEYRLTIRGYDFSPNSAVNVTCNGMLRASTITNANGNFITSFDVPIGTSSYEIEAMDEKCLIYRTVFSPAVGGIWVPVDKFGLLAPYIGVASTFVVAAAATAIYAKRVKRRKKK